MAMTKMDCAYDRILTLIERLPSDQMVYILDTLSVGTKALELLGRMDIDLCNLSEYHKAEAKSLVDEWDTRIKADS